MTKNQKPLATTQEKQDLNDKYRDAALRTLVRGGAFEDHVNKIKDPKAYDHKAKVQADFDKFMADKFPDDHADYESDKAWTAITPEARANDGKPLQLVMGQIGVGNVVRIDVNSIDSEYPVDVRNEEVA